MINSWDQSLETGNEMIDRQHRQLLGLLEEIKGMRESDQEILRLLDKVMDFTITHFLSEEELMAEVDYPAPATKTMVDGHKEFKAYVRLRVLEFRQEETFNVASFKSFVEHYLKVHEFDLDRQLVNWIHLQDDNKDA